MGVGSVKKVASAARKVWKERCTARAQVMPNKMPGKTGITHLIEGLMSQVQMVEQGIKKEEVPPLGRNRKRQEEERENEWAEGVRELQLLAQGSTEVRRGARIGNLVLLEQRDCAARGGPPARLQVHQTTLPTTYTVPSAVHL